LHSNLSSQDKRRLDLRDPKTNTHIDNPPPNSQFDIETHAGTSRRLERPIHTRREVASTKRQIAKPSAPVST
jgi:hypothetical protein